MDKWFVAAKRADFEGIAKQLNISPILARILRNRDLTEPDEMRSFLEGSLSDCHSPHAMLDLDKAALRIRESIVRGDKIRVIGDYDVDGVCSSYILTEGMRRLGAEVDTVIPHRIHDGYGLSDSLIEDAAAEGVRLIVTCDNGIAAASQIQKGISLGMELIVTDHHEVPFVTEGEKRVEVLPPAYAVVDPKREQDTYPFSGICGGVVAFKVIQALYELWEQEHPETKEALQETCEEFIEFAALSTVCDVMELKDENRILVKEGLKRMAHTKNPGLKALMEVNGLNPSGLSVYHLGFVLGPCLNATGRLDSAKNALKLLECRDEKQVVELAEWLKQLNDSRKNLTKEGLELAIQTIEETGMEQDRVLVVFLEDVHESLAGIIAGKLRERYNKPTFVLTRGEEGIKGSGRSIDAYSMYEALVEVKEHLTKFGGHKLAAGLSLEESEIEPFRKALNDNCTLSEEDFYRKIKIDIPMPAVFANLALAEELERLEPFGTGNAKPLFADKNLLLRKAQVIGKNKNVLKLYFTEEGKELEMVSFSDPDQFMAFMQDKYGEEAKDALLEGRGAYPVTAAYQVEKNVFRGKTSVSYVLQYYC